MENLLILKMSSATTLVLTALNRRYYSESSIHCVPIGVYFFCMLNRQEYIEALFSIFVVAVAILQLQSCIYNIRPRFSALH